MFPAMQALVDTMLDRCRGPRAMVSLGAQAIVPEVYTAIMSGFEAVRDPGKTSSSSPSISCATTSTRSRCER